MHVQAVDRIVDTAEPSGDLRKDVVHKRVLPQITGKKENRGVHPESLHLALETERGIVEPCR
jgi:hypothetical protein